MDGWGTAGLGWPGVRCVIRPHDPRRPRSTSPP